MPFFPVGVRIGDESDKFLVGGLVGHLLADGMRSGTIRMDQIFRPPFGERQVHRLLGESPQRGNLSDGDFFCRSLPNGIQIGRFSAGFLAVAGLQSKFLPLPVRYHQPIVVRTAFDLLPQISTKLTHSLPALPNTIRFHDVTILFVTLRHNIAFKTRVCNKNGEEMGKNLQK